MVNQHHLCGIPCTEESSSQIEIEHSVPVRQLSAQKEIVSDDSRIVDQDIEPTEFLLKVFKQSLHRIGTRDIRLKRFRFSSLLSNLLQKALGLIFRLIVINDDFGPCLSKEKTDLTTNPSRSSCHQSNLPCQIE